MKLILHDYLKSCLYSDRFGELPDRIIERIKSIHDLDKLNQLLQQAIAIDSRLE